VVLVHPRLVEIEGEPVLNDLSAITEPVDTVTMYVGPDASNAIAEKLIALRPRRVIFNPGSENPGLQKRLADSGARVEEACTLVLLSTGQF
jgi:predicted CoA-binding protein